MKTHGSQVRFIATVVFFMTFVLAFVCHRIEAAWFWGAVGVVMVLAILTVLGLELLRLLAPDWTDDWWDRH